MIHGISQNSWNRACHLLGAFAVEQYAIGHDGHAFVAWMNRNFLRFALADTADGRTFSVNDALEIVAAMAFVSTSLKAGVFTEYIFDAVRFTINKEQDNAWWQYNE